MFSSFSTRFLLLLFDFYLILFFFVPFILSFHLRLPLYREWCKFVGLASACLAASGAFPGLSLILLLPIQGPFLFLGEGHLILTNSSMLPISHSGSINIPPAWATLIHFLGLRGMALLICFYPLISSLFLGLVWDFLPLALWVHIIKSGFQHMVKL